VFTVDVTDVNEAPYLVKLTGNKVLTVWFLHLPIEDLLSPHPFDLVTVTSDLENQ
jgi:hypothetical protein